MTTLAQQLSKVNPDAPLVATMTGMKVKHQPTYAEWETFGRELWSYKQAIQWCIGDWLNYGEKHYGDTYTQAIDMTNYTYGTLANYASVAREFPPERRREDVSFTNHQELAPLDTDEQDIFLNAIETKQATRDDIRNYKRERRAAAESSRKHENPNRYYIDAPVRVRVIEKVAYAVIQLPRDYPVALLRNWIAKIPKPDSAKEAA